MVYTVRSGDTVTAIAKQHNIPVSALISANPNKLANPNFINPGLDLVIPEYKDNRPFEMLFLLGVVIIGGIYYYGKEG
ncbi:MAG: LysM peptidoglycan-binding domain-containing protein [Bacteroidetes bacterium]|nr:LysM peptidoglycan-binding domain-containing protein [Bacteroidota bacterium]MBT7617806.1 LysM peptidoglycan-binding domain-containing protein [Calditrichota bacterium]